MVVIKAWAGLGNKMFQYALYKSFLYKGLEAVLDEWTHIPKRSHEIIILKDIFPNLNYKTAEKTLINKLNENKNDFLSRIRRKIYRMLKIQISYSPNHIIDESFAFNKNIFGLNGNYYLEGFWQSEKYFEDIKETIKKDFEFPSIHDKQNNELLNELKSVKSVSIHIRKGKDYKKPLFSGTCGLDYYVQAINTIKSQIENPKFYIFSDNFEWCKENLSFCDPVYVDWNSTYGPLNYLDMQLMSNCKHNIIANSSYSWWGAWLNKNPNKIVIGPKKWFNSSSEKFDSSDIIPENWTKL